MTSIRGRLLVMLLGGLLVVLAAGGTVVYWSTSTSLTRQFDARLEARAHTLASLTAHEPGRLVFDSEDASLMIGETYFELRSREGELLKRSENLGDTALPERDLVENAMVFADLDLPGPTAGRAVWLAFRPRVEEDDEGDAAGDDDRPAIPGDLQVLVVVAALDRGPVDRALGTLLGTLIVVGGALALMIVLLVTIGIRWGLAPLDRLSRQLGAVDERTISRRLEDTGAPRELRPVYRELNEMLDRVEQTLERERSFAGAAAHELRTPLAELRTTAEVAVRWPDVERATAALLDVLAIGQEMERLVDYLLLIGRGDAMDASGDDVSIGPIIHHCVDRSGESISEKRLQLTIDVDDRSRCRGPRDAVEIIVRNLIDNAVQYTPVGGRVHVMSNGASKGTGNGMSSSTRNGSPLLVIENDPVDLAESDLPRLFEPFWRQEGARSDREHAGLGLAVVGQVADAIGLHVDAGLAGDRLRIEVSEKIS